MNHIIDIVKGLFSNFLFWLIPAIFPIAIALYDYPYDHMFGPKLIQVIIIWAVNIFVLILTVMFFNRRTLQFNSREESMKANLNILQKNPTKRQKKYIFSTRITYWDLGEKSKARQEFRSFLTQRIQDGFLVKRIWQIRSVEDFERMIMYLELYKEHDNYNLKCFIGKNSFIPDILSNSGLIASVSIPQSNDPQRIVASFQYFAKREIAFWEDYFNLLWDQSISIKIGNVIDYGKILEMKTTFPKA